MCSAMITVLPTESHPFQNSKTYSEMLRSSTPLFRL